VEVIAGDHACRQFLSPGGKPEADFANPEGEMTVRAYCNIHGLWKA
jgi:superoxide reductase